MYFFEDLYVTCDKYDGRRYRPDVLRIRYKGKNISEVLQMTVHEAAIFFRDHKTLRERLKICSEIIRREARAILYLLDEPTTGLHFDDIRKLIHIFNRLVNSGNTVVVIEHNEVLKER